MTTLLANGLRIEVEQHGDESAWPLLLVRGLGTQLVHWPGALVDGFVAWGFRVIVFDNRDAGLSQKLDDRGVPDLDVVRREVAAGRAAPVPYTLAEMAADAVGVLDALDLESAHVLGVSMGGMIVQLIAHDHPDRARSATIVMSSAGNPARDPEVERELLSGPDDPGDREQVIEHTLRCDRLWGSPGFPFDPAERRAQVARAYDRCHCPDGITRQYAAILANGSRAALLGSIRVPTLVVHGTADRLVPIAEGRALAAAIPGADLVEIDGMGHDLEGGISRILVDATTRLARRAEAR